MYITQGFTFGWPRVWWMALAIPVLKFFVVFEQGPHAFILHWDLPMMQLVLENSYRAAGEMVGSVEPLPQEGSSAPRCPRTKPGLPPQLLPQSKAQSLGSLSCQVTPLCPAPSRCRPAARSQPAQARRCSPGMTSLLFELCFCPWPTAWQRLGQRSSWMNPGGHWRVSHPAESNLLIWQPPGAASAMFGAFKGNDCKT